MTTFIYSITDDKGRLRYIGKSNNPQNRIYSHIREKSNLHKFNWLKSIIERGNFPIIEIIDEVPEEEWQFWEKYWINQFKQWGFKLLNISNGGDGFSVGHKISVKTRLKMRKAKLGNKLSIDHKKKISDSVKIKASENPMYNRGEGNSKIVLDKELMYQKYIVENYSMPKLSKELGVSEKVIFQNLKDHGIEKDKSIWRKQCASNESKPVYLFSETGQIINHWDSVEVSSIDLGISRSLISSRCRNNYKADGYIWGYYPKLDKNPFDKLRKVKKYNLNGELLNEFNSIKEASLTGFNENNIQDCCVGRSKSHKGYLWRYSEDDPPKKYSNKTIKKIIQYSINMEFIKEWDSIVSASKSLGIRSNCITTCCKGKYKSSGGFIWKYT